MELNKSIFSERPDFIVGEGAQVRINFDIEEITVKEEAVDSDNKETKERTAFEAYVVRVAHPVTRDRVIDAIVTAAYPADKMQAILNNHLMEADSEEHELQFKQMQQWRIKAKEVATEVVAAMQH